VKRGDLVRFSAGSSPPGGGSLFVVLDRRRGIVLDTEMVCVLLHPATLTMFPVYERELELIRGRDEP